MEPTPDPAGKLKAEIVRDPGRFIELDPELPRTLLDQRQAGKTLLLITNSDNRYTDAVMTHAFDQFLPPGMRWRDLFDFVIVNARKPDFFRSSQPLYEVVTDEGLMRPAATMERGGMYSGGTAKQVEAALGISGDDILYVGGACD
jgi:HAD superfamily 5'-nucleotidase-like hydrolase